MTKKKKLQTPKLSNNLEEKESIYNSLGEQRAVIYCRTAVLKQETDLHGIKRQEKVCREWCLIQSPPIIVDKVFKEPGISGATLDREVFNTCIEYVRNQNKGKKKITHFVVSDASRILRPTDFVDFSTMRKIMESTGVEEVFTENMCRENTKTPCDYLLKYIKPNTN